MRIHLVTFATRRFLIRQMILGLSARLNGVADSVTSWNPNALSKAGFCQELPEIDLAARGSGYWAWKPFIIFKKLREIPDGDIVFYCDVGRRYPFKTLEHSVGPYLDWMQKHGQDVMPGLSIPWRGPMSMWTKRVAFMEIGLDTEAAHRSIPIQASFSFWRAGASSRALCAEWLHLAAQSQLINDDRSPSPNKQLPDYFEHRHDQSLLSLCCLKAGIAGIEVGTTMPTVDTQHPNEILVLLGHTREKIPLAGRCLTFAANALSSSERLIRKRIKFGKDRPEPNTHTVTDSK